jgi:DNA polymerase-3 subunit chi
MTQVDFYTHVEDKLHTAALLCGKAVERGMRVVVYAPDTGAADAVDGLLWTVPPTGFIPHCPPEDALAPVTPVIIDRRATASSHDDVLINLSTERPAYFSRFQRLVEIVGPDEEDRQAARERYRFYRDRGYEIRSHDLSKNRRGPT